MSNKFKYTPSELTEQWELYKTKCYSDHVFPDVAGFRNFAKITKKEYELMYSDDEYSWNIEEMNNYRESNLARKMASEPKVAQGCMSLLKQRDNGGYSEKKDDNSDKTLKVVIKGGYGAELFK